MSDESPASCWISATEAARGIAAGTLSSEDLVRACLARIARREPEVRAFVHLDAEAALRTARERDKQPARGALHGVPIAVKDTIMTADMPTQHNSPIHAGAWPRVDAACVVLARAAGAVILGKSETLEFAAGGRLAATRNPHDRSRSPGGSSSGSAAAVADGMVPVALGTQTGGSMIRPGSFCGVYAFKPTWAAVSTEGAKLSALSMDCIGWYGRDMRDIQLLAGVYAVPRLIEMGPRAAATLRIALCRSPVWPRAGAATRAAIDQAAERLRAAGVAVEELTLPPAFDGMAAAQRTIMFVENGAALLPEYRTAPALLHDELRARVENRTRITPQQLAEAYDLAAAGRVAFDRIAGGYDAILTPSVAGEANPYAEGHGDPSFNGIWSLLHVPCLNLPGYRTATGLPVGVQLVGGRFSDGRLLAVGAAIAPIVAGTDI